MTKTIFSLPELASIETTKMMRAQAKKARTIPIGDLNRFRIAFMDAPSP
jgi:hypothetical protein